MVHWLEQCAENLKVASSNPTPTSSSSVYPGGH